MIRTREMQRIEARLGAPIEEILHRLYVAEGLTLDEVGAVLGVTGSVVSRWLERCGIPARRPGMRARGRRSAADAGLAAAKRGGQR